MARIWLPKSYFDYFLPVRAVGCSRCDVVLIVQQFIRGGGGVRFHSAYTYIKRGFAATVVRHVASSRWMTG